MFEGSLPAIKDDLIDYPEGYVGKVQRAIEIVLDDALVVRVAGFVFVNEDAEVLLLATYLDNNFPLLNALSSTIYTCIPACAIPACSSFVSRKMSLKMSTNTKIHNYPLVDFQGIFVARVRVR